MRRGGVVLMIPVVLGGLGLAACSGDGDEPAGAGPAATVTTAVGAAPVTPCEASETVTVAHGPVPAPTTLDLGEPGESPGDVRIFHFDATADDGQTVRTDWVMTTTAIDAPEPGLDTRLTTGDFAFGAGDDQLLLEGTAAYPGTDATLKPSATTVRALIGGGGRYAGATGWVVSTHLEDDTWTHVFHIC